jgi:hypothetical protein
MLTAIEYNAFQRAYDYFNGALFDRDLPQVLVTLQHHRGARGYFCAEAFQSRQSGATTHELALNPDCFDNRTDEQILSTLVHEMTHVWQQSYGKPGRRGYHNREWARCMKGVGLQPTCTGELGGKETGESVTHYIIANGPFALTCRSLLDEGFVLTWQTRWIPVDPSDPTSQDARGTSVVAGRRGRSATRARFSCPSCGLKAWAKPSAHLLCGTCLEGGRQHLMLSHRIEPTGSGDEGPDVGVGAPPS